MTLDKDLAPFTEINSKWMLDLNMHRPMIKLPEGNLGEKRRLWVWW